MKDLDILIAEKHEAMRNIEKADNNADKLHYFGQYLKILSDIEILTGYDLINQTLQPESRGRREEWL